jgi:glycosyltransferase involved in cell wall biosynthesis
MARLVSILIPAFNAEAWLRETIESAINQTWQNKEIIIVDDGSIDNTHAIAKSFECNIVKAIRQENCGASAARNKALEVAQGDYIQWLDADDLLEPTKISEQLTNGDLVSGNNTLLSSPFGKFYFRPQKAKFCPNRLWKSLFPIEWLSIKFTDNAWIANSCWLVSRELTERAGKWSEELSFDDDGEYFCRVVAGSHEVQFIPQARSYYRIGSVNSLSKGRSMKACRSMYLSTKLSIDHLLFLEDSENTRAACLKYWNRWFYHFFPGGMIDLGGEEFEDLRQFIRELNIIAVKLGGVLKAPNLNWKYYIVQRVFGRKVAIKLREITYNGRMVACRYWDSLLHRLAI